MHNMKTATGYSLVFVWSSLVVFPTLVQTEEEHSPSRIAVIGAGLGGTSAAFYLRELFGPKVQIDIFEADTVGGRTALINIGGQDYEAGGSVIHKKNKYMVEFTNKFNKSANEPSSKDIFFGLCDESGIFFQTSTWEIVGLAKLLWRYGLDLYSSQHWTNTLVEKNFVRIYELQEQGIAFTTLKQMLEAMSENFLNMTQHSLKDVLSDAGLSQRFISELAMAAMRTNYGQTTETHGFVGAVSLLGAEPGLWSVRSGNKQIAVSLLNASQASLIKAKVKSVGLLKDQPEPEDVSYEVTYEEAGPDDIITSSKEYDIVVMAAPIFGSRHKVEFVNFPHDVTPFSQNYHTTVAMFVQGTVNASTFQLHSRSEFPPGLFTTNPNLFFSAIGQQSAVLPEAEEHEKTADAENVWKTFFNKVPTEEQISHLFDSRREVKLVEWLAYPEYKPKMDLPPFALHDKLYYINAIESAASAMEMSVIGARNVALLAFNHWHGHVDKINQVHLPSEYTRSDL